MSKEKSLASRLESNPGAGLPTAFQGGQTEIAVGESLFQPTPYVQFISSKGQSFGEIARQIRDLQDGDPVLVIAKQARKLNPFRFYCISAFQHFSMVDQLGIIVKSTLDAQAARQDRAWQEHIEMVVIVVDDNDLVPARCTFKTTKTNCAHTAIKALRHVRMTKADAEAEGVKMWAEQSAEHKATMAVPLDWARFTCTATLKRGTSKSSGFAYVAANGFVEPTGVSDWQLLSECLKDEKFILACQETQRRHESRVAEIRGKVV